jgi:outer membrane protein assembly factor BamB
LSKVIPAAIFGLALYGCAHLDAENHAAKDGAGLQIAEVVWRAALIDADMFSHRTQHRSAPAISPDGTLLLIGTSQGKVVCLDNRTGAIRWSFRTESPSDVEILIAGKTAFLAGGDGAVYSLVVDDGKLIWKNPLAKVISVAPVLYEDKLYLQTDDDEVICLQAADGRWLWRYKHPAVTGDRFKVIGGSRPVVGEKAIYASFSDGVLVKLSPAGSVLASRTLHQEKDKFWDADVDPILAGGRLLAGSFSGGIFALNPEDLSIIWNTKLEGPSDLWLSGDRVFVTTSDSEVAALSLADGALLWKSKIEKAGLLSTPVNYRSWLFICSEELSFIVVDATNGTLKQTFNPGKGCSARPSIHDKSLWWISNGETAYFMKIND